MRANRTLPSLPERQRGVALVLALLVVAVVAIMALLFTQRQQLWLRQLENRNGLTVATTSAYAAINMCRLTLRDDARKNQVDHALETWTIPIPPMNVEQGRIAGHITEQNGRFNLTNLLPATGESVDPSDAALARAAKAFGVSASDLAHVLRSFQDVRKREPHGTPELTELIQRASLSDSSAASLLKHTVVLPDTAPINVNFADAESLQAAIEGLTSGEASAVIARRAGSPFLTLDSFKKTLPEGRRSAVTSSAASIQSLYFLVKIDAWFNDIHLGYEAMLYRSGTDFPTILWTRRSSLADS